MKDRMSLFKDLVGAAMFMIVAGVFLLQLGDVPEAAAKYPSTLVCLIFALCLALISKSIAGLSAAPAGKPAACPADGGGEPEEEGKTRRYAGPIVLLISFLYIFSMPYIGFTIASAIMLVAFMFAAGVRNPWVIVLTPIIEISFLMYVFESLMGVYLPNADALREWLGWI